MNAKFILILGLKIFILTSCLKEEIETIDENIESSLPLPTKGTARLGSASTNDTIIFDAGYLEIKDIKSHNILFSPKLGKILNYDIAKNQLAFLAFGKEGQDSFLIEYIGINNKRDSTLYYYNVVDNHFYFKMKINGKDWESHGEAYHKPTDKNGKIKIQAGFFIPHQIINFYIDDYKSLELNKTYKLDAKAIQNALIFSTSVDDNFLFEGEFKLIEWDSRIIKGTVSGKSIANNKGHVFTIQNGEFRAIIRG